MLDAAGDEDEDMLDNGDEVHGEVLNAADMLEDADASVEVHDKLDDNSDEHEDDVIDDIETMDDQ